jgi:hypothetical protein
MGVHCSRSQSPFSSDAALEQQAVLDGTVVLSGNSTASFGAIQVGVKGTSLYTNPDGNGNFLIENLPIGNIVVEVSVQSDMSDIQIDDVKSGEQIRITVEVQSNNQAVLANMERDEKFTGELQVQIQPNKWNLDWVDSEDKVVAKISGDGHDTIQTTSVEIFGPDGILKIENTSLEFDVGGTYFQVIFSRKDAIGLIDEPLTGMEYDITVKSTDGIGNVLFALTDTIEIVGKMPRESEELSIQVNPKKWNINLEKSSGTVMVKFWGDGYDQIVPSTVRMIGPDAVGIIPAASNLTDDHLIVKFSKKEALSIIPDPTPGEKPIIITITGETDDLNVLSTFSFEYAVKIVGSKK